MWLTSMKIKYQIVQFFDFLIKWLEKSTIFKSLSPLIFCTIILAPSHTHYFVFVVHNSVLSDKPSYLYWQCQIKDIYTKNLIPKGWIKTQKKNRKHKCEKSYLLLST